MSVRIYGVRELRDKLASYLESTVPIEVTRHGQTIGFYIPVPRQPGQGEREALFEAGHRMQGEVTRLDLPRKNSSPISSAGERRAVSNRPLVIDANILIRAVLGVRVRALIERCSNSVDF